MADSARLSLRRTAGYVVEPLLRRPLLLLTLAATWAILALATRMAFSTGILPAGEGAVWRRLADTLVVALTSGFLLQACLSSWRTTAEEPGRLAHVFPPWSALPTIVASEFIRNLIGIGARSTTENLDALGPLLLASTAWQALLTVFLGFAVPIALDRGTGLIASAQASLELTHGRRWLMLGLSAAAALALGLVQAVALLAIGAARSPALLSALVVVYTGASVLALAGLYREFVGLRDQTTAETFD
ncbi:hypothetical protein GVN21_06455 [Caulobacter sp. SLTY]|uniref:hypothetical protein n=1 Tax=Caulobacter sp. SLTY TaxID=2683262 RepID=UPI001411C0B9|nr:hypothetical protein [Caulobacter sp. SLTY]NBB14993.1 hypothetical protein [Caulobacter sp. SLTY]